MQIRTTIFLLIGVATVVAQSVAVFVPHDLFREEEFERISRRLERANFSVVIVSSETTAAQGIDGLLIKPEKLVKDLTPEGFAGLILINGSGIVCYWKDTVLQERCRQFAAAGRLVAAIELAPIILAHAGVLAGKKATVFPHHYSINILKDAGCRYQFNPVVIDDNIITAARAEHTPQFVQTIVKKLKGK